MSKIYLFPLKINIQKTYLQSLLIQRLNYINILYNYYNYYLPKYFAIYCKNMIDM